MRKKKKRLTLKQAEGKLLHIISKHLATLPPEEAEERIEKAHRRLTDRDAGHDTGSRSSEPHPTVASPLSARSRR